MDTASEEPKCKTCKDTGRVLTTMEAVHAPPAPMMMIKVYGKCPEGCAAPTLPESR